MSDSMSAGLLAKAQTKMDPLGWSAATASVLGSALRRPLPTAAAGARLVSGLAGLPMATVGKTLALSVNPPIASNPKDRRFSDPAWESNPYFFAVRQVYDLTCRYVDEVLEAGHTDDLSDLKAALTAHLVTDALAPTNFLVTNPTAMVTAFQTGGKSLGAGAKLAMADLRERKGMPQKVDTTGFTLGENLAATPGSVVFRNDLIELIQYLPQTDQVHAVPLLASPPWINKYYVMDLAPTRSLVEWAVQHHRTVFMISYRNPDESMQGVTLDDYLEQGILAAMEVVQDITGAATVDLLGLCLGGVMTAMAAAHLAARDDDRLGSITMLNTILDYEEPGELAAFVDPESLNRIDARMQETGFLDAKDMALAFDLLRARDLIFRYIPERWLLGKESAPFDILAWNGDATRMPAAMHSSYLRLLYGQNLLAKGEMSLAGERLDLGEVGSDVYVVGAINDHIVPWTSSYCATQLLGGNVRYVLSSGGHIAGVVNPPSPKSWLEVCEPDTPNPVDPAEWRAKSTKEQGSWWDDWIQWSTTRAGKLVAAPKKVGNRKYLPMGDAPGTYVEA